MKQLFSRSHFGAHVFLCMALFSFFSGHACFGRLVNYENDPDLAKALGFDAEYNGSNLAVSSQSLAEQYYLKYLEKCKDTSQRAKVYCQLGVLYGTNWYPENGEKPDYKKSVMYMKKVLKEEPKRIGRETVRARCFMITPLQNDEETMKLRLDNYAWFQETKKLIESTDDKSDIWLPEIPGKALNEDNIKYFLTVFKAVLDTQEYNMVSQAFDFSKPVDKITHLKEIIDRFPGTKAEESAKAKLVIVQDTIKKQRGEKG